MPAPHVRSVLVAFALCLSVLLSACGPRSATPNASPELTAEEEERQRRIVLESDNRYKQELAAVTTRLKLSNVELCGEKVGPLVGFTVGAIHDVDEEWQEAYRAVLGYDENLRVIAVAPGSPAEAAGLVHGDIIKEVNFTAIPADDSALETYLKAYGEIDFEEPFCITYEREGLRRVATIIPVTACSQKFNLVRDVNINASATEKSIFVTTAMLDFAETPDELSVVLGHELAHSSMGHIEAMKGRATGGMFADILLGALTGVYTNTFARMAAGAYSVEYEQEADYVGAYMSRRAGFDVACAPDLWGRMATLNPVYINEDSTHPSTAKRAVALREVFAEMDAKVAGGQELVPEMKPEDEPKKVSQGPIIKKAN